MNELKEQCEARDEAAVLVCRAGACSMPIRDPIALTAALQSAPAA